MKTESLNNDQLFAIIQNEKLDNTIRSEANKEFNRRSLGKEEIASIIARHDQQFKPEKYRLAWPYQLLIILYPFAVPLWAILFGRKGMIDPKTKMRPYLKLVILGYILWTAAILLFSRHFFIK